MKTTSLHDRHVSLGAKMADFGGWEMPIEYPATALSRGDGDPGRSGGGGVLAEHAAVRERVGVFDVSHLGKASVTGPGAADFVNSCLTNDLGRIKPGQAQYTLCCDESGGVVDDLIAYLRSDDDVLLVPNAANTAAVAQRLADAAPPGVDVMGLHEAYAIVAIQGPRSPGVMRALGLPDDLGYMAFAEDAWEGHAATVCRTGYTGEHGYEVLVRWDDADQLWDAALAAVRAEDGLPCGLGARDTLRTEMGYPLHGHELALDISPLQARAGWAVGWGKPAFWGREALLAEKERGPARVLWGLRATDRSIPRQGMAVSSASGVGGVVTSGTFSPTLRVGIGLALLSGEVAPGDTVDVDIRGRNVPMEVVKPPFVSSSPR
ncbi:MAG TPA: glycine cleavage system aminomethyltransferase GcvT [Frankiaceae bacterium]|nr:glycine cleavage system aminomethyltransferase GcvT [Frankiaceae bacterium]